MTQQIIVITEDRLREIIREEAPEGKKISPQDQYVTTEELSKIMKVSPQMINSYKNDYGMTGDYGENLWDWQIALGWRKEYFAKGRRKK